MSENGGTQYNFKYNENMVTWNNEKMIVWGNNGNMEFNFLVKKKRGGTSKYLSTKHNLRNGHLTCQHNNNLREMT